jgi:hypothetical protein
MKKYVAIIALTAYAVVSNYCLVYAVVTGKPHMPGFLESNGTGAPSHPGCKGHPPENSESHSHKHDSSEGNGTCCVSMQCDNPIVLSSPQILSKPIIVYEFLPLQLSEILADASSPIFYRRDHDPPRLSSSQLFSSPRSPRAPPSFLQSL